MVIHKKTSVSLKKKLLVASFAMF